MGLGSTAWAQTRFPSRVQSLTKGLLKGDEAVESNSNKLTRLLYYLEHAYLDTLDINRFTDQMITGALEQLDPHSSYITVQDVQAMNEPLEGSFEGIGVEFMILRDSLVVATPISGGPSEQVGIRAEDRIVAVDSLELSTVQLTNEKVFSLLRGPKGSKLRLGVVRKGQPQRLWFTVTRDKIPMNSLESAYEAAPGVAYVKLTRFAQTSMEEFIDAFEPGKIFSAMPKALIIDLRGNGGGYLHVALSLADQFLAKGQLMLYTEGNKHPRRDNLATGQGFFQTQPVVLLIDNHSASASEILSGALQDWDRGIVIGRRSFGKGLVQQMLPFEDGAQLRLTVARYHTPSGRVIQSAYENGKKDDYYKAHLDRYESGELFTADSIHVADSLKYKTLRTGRTVYGGGGIVPDLFVPIDTSYFSPFYTQLVRDAVVTEFINDYLDRHLTRLGKEFKTYEAFDKAFTPAHAPFDALLDFARGKGLTCPEEDRLASEATIRVQLKALIARRLFGTGAYYRVFNTHGDAAYDKALEVLSRWPEYSQQIFKAR